MNIGSCWIVLDLHGPPKLGTFVDDRSDGRFGKMKSVPSSRKVLAFAKREMFALKMGSIHSKFNQRNLLCNMPTAEQEQEEKRWREEREERERERQGHGQGPGAPPESSSTADQDHLFHQDQKQDQEGEGGRSQPQPRPPAEMKENHGGEQEMDMTMTQKKKNNNYDHVVHGGAASSEVVAAGTTLCELDDANLCQTCMCSPVEVITYPCKHKTLCIDCLQIILNEQQQQLCLMVF